MKYSPYKLRLSISALQRIIDYSWPGNIRELKNVLEQASILKEDGIVKPQHMPAITGENPSHFSDLDDRMIPIDDKLNLIEKEIIIEALRKTGGIQVKAAGILGINRRSLWHRIKKLNIDIDNIKNLQ